VALNTITPLLHLLVEDKINCSFLFIYLNFNVIEKKVAYCLFDKRASSDTKNENVES
jgi:hypothetical protein